MKILEITPNVVNITSKDYEKLKESYRDQIIY